MADIISGLRYSSGIEKLETEEQLFDIFSELKENYNKFKKQFEIFDCEGNLISGFSDFLVQAVEEKGKVFLEGSGEIAGLTVKDATLEYDLSDVVRLTRYWDIHRNRDCFACYNNYRVWVDEDDSISRCKKGHKGYRREEKCGDDFDARIKNSLGKAARTLQEMVEAAVKIYT